MYLFRTIIILMTLAMPFSVWAQEDYHSPDEIEALLKTLDDVVADKLTYQAMRQHRADSLEKVVATCSPEDVVEKSKELYEALNDFDGKRTIGVLQNIEGTTQYQTDKNLQAWVKLNEAQAFCTMGLYHKARALLNGVNPSVLSKAERLHYYYTSLSTFQQIAEYISDDEVTQEEERNMAAYYDSILALQPLGVERDITIANKELFYGNLESALDAAKRSLSRAQDKEYIYLCALLAEIHAAMGDQQSRIYYLTLTSISDLQNGTTEYQALPYLVQALFENEDIDRAYKYLVCAMEDANFYPARNLATKVSSYFPLVNQAYDEKLSYLISSDKMKRNSLAVTYAMLALAICVAFYLGWRYNNTQVQKRRADELQKALDKASIADRIKTVFIQNMRHEIRTPLNAIMGFAQLMSNDLSTEERALYNGYIQESNNQLLSTLDDIIDVSNMEVGTFNFTFKDVDVDNLCQQKIEDLHELRPEKVELIYTPSHPGLKFCTDEKRVGQVIYNLLSNACKNTTEGVIRLNATHNAVEDSLQFVVADTGIGIPPDKTDVIFEHFEKLDHYSPGLGLGLYVCRLIARALGGDIYLDTSYHGGARFVFTVPNKHHKSHAANEKLTVHHT